MGGQRHGLYTVEVRTQDLGEALRLRMSLCACVLESKRPGVLVWVLRSGCSGCLAAQLPSPGPLNPPPPSPHADMTGGPVPCVWSGVPRLCSRWCSESERQPSWPY